MTKLKVITHTRFARPDLLKRCEQSVKEALPPGAEHLIIECWRDWAEARLLAATSHELVAFVDDDDEIHKDSLRLCLEALQSGLGAACTDEVSVDSTGAERKSTYLKTYEGVAKHPRAVHHLCVFRGHLVDPYALELHHKFGVGVDWFIKASVVLQHGCVHIPIDGYRWHQHSGQMTREHQALNARFIHEMSQAIRERWSTSFTGPLPKHL